MLDDLNLGGLNIEAIIESDREKKRQKKSDHQETVFKQYLELVRKDPLIAQNSSSRILEIIQDAGTKPIPLEDRWLKAEVYYNLFAGELYGVEDSIMHIVRHIEEAAVRASTGKQILLIVGPPATGKSTTAKILMKALENYRKRPIFTIKGCPKFEEPLHLLPRYLRSEFEKSLGVKIEGDLCPVCLNSMNSKFKEEDGSVRWWDIPVETFTFSIQGVRGISSFEPSDEKTSDITALTGRENIGITSNPAYGYSHPQAFEICGEIPKAERGLIEFREVLSSDREVLKVFFSLGEEKEIKVQGSNFPHLSVDTVVLGHTNLTVFKEFNTTKKFEGLHNRFVVVPMPYPLRMKDEERLYQKLIERESDLTKQEERDTTELDVSKLKRSHIAPGSLKLASLFAVLTRYIDSTSGISKLVKAKIYNGDKAITEIKDKDKAPIDVRALKEEGQDNPNIAAREGMFGVSSRDVLAALNDKLVEGGCLTPLSVIKYLDDLFKSQRRMGYEPEEVEHFRELLSAENGSVMSEYKDFCIRAVNKAFIGAYEDLAEKNFKMYMTEADLWCEQHSSFVRNSIDIQRDELTQKPKEADVKFMRSVEVQIPISETEAGTFRSEILHRSRRQKDFGYKTYQPLAQAVEKQLLEDNVGILKLILSEDKVQTAESTKRAKDLFDGLSEKGFCRICAKEIMDRAAEFLTQ